MTEAIRTLFNNSDVATPQRETLNREMFTPLYHRIDRTVKSRIVSGGEQMPTEHQLVQLFDVSRIAAKSMHDCGFGGAPPRSRIGPSVSIAASPAVR